MSTPKVLDPCCGSRMFYFDKNNPNVLFCDNRLYSGVLCDGRKLEVSPDLVADVCDLPFDDEAFSLGVVDPPHLTGAGKSGWQALKYGILPDDWKAWMTRAFSECFRVLAPNGTLIFKWYEYRIRLNEVLACAPCEPLFGNRAPHNSKTHWVVFFKSEEEANAKP